MLQQVLRLVNSDGLATSFEELRKGYQRNGLEGDTPA